MTPAEALAKCDVCAYCLALITDWISSPRSQRTAGPFCDWGCWYMWEQIVRGAA